MNERLLKSTTKPLRLTSKSHFIFPVADLYRVNNRQEEAIAKLRKGISLSFYDAQANDPTARYLLEYWKLK